MPSTLLPRAVLAAAALSAVAAPAFAQEWPVAGGDPAHTGAAAGPRPPFEVAWREVVDAGGTLSAPVASGELVVVVAPEEVVALDLTTGAERWTVKREEGPVAPAALGGGLAIFAEGRRDAGALVAVSLDDGAEAWRADLERPGIAAASADGDRAYAATANGMVHAFALDDGAPAWSFEADGRIATTPAVGEGLVVVAAENFAEGLAVVQAIDERGEEAWRFAPQGVSLGVSAAAIGEDSVFLGLGDYRARALDLRSGTERWATRSRAAFAPRATPAIAGGAVVLTDRVGHIHAFEAAGGEERWVYRVPGHLLDAAPAVAGDAVLVGDASGQASAIDLRSGHLVWRSDLGDGPIAAPALAGDHVLLVCCGGEVVALRTDPGGTLLDLPSPTTLFPGRALANFGIAAVPMFVALLLLIRLAPIREQRPPEAEPRGEDQPA